MRFLNGIVVGVLLCVGVAYWHDRGADADRMVVNWDEFGRGMNAVGDWVKAQVDGLGETLHRRG